MSAIWALIYDDGRPVDPADLARMSDALAPLGPERCEQWQHGPAGLGHRLMAFTPEDLRERQPLRGADGRHVLVFDGRLDNRPELAAALQLSPEEAREWPDSAYVARAFQAWGENCPARLVGGLACIVWDTHARRLFAFSTPGNSCPLFYYHAPHVLALASMPRGLLALPFVPSQLDVASLARFLAHASGGDRTATFFAGIQRLPAGHTLAAEAGPARIQRYWSPDPSREIRLARDDDYVEAFSALFERVIGDHLRSLTPVGVMMSGGLDSTSVAAVAAAQLKARGQDLMSFTAVPDAGANAGQFLPAGRIADETPFVMAVASQHDNLDPVFVSTGGQCYLDGLDSRFDHFQAPPVAAANRVWLDAALRAAGERGRRVVFTGEAGNYAVSWSGDGLIHHYLRQGSLGRAWREARGLARHSQARSALGALLADGLAPFVPQPAWSALQLMRGRAPRKARSPINPSFAAEHGLTLNGAKPPVSRRNAAGSRGMAYHVAVNRIDHIAQARRSQFGLDTRDPTGDQRVLEFCLALPYEQFQRDGQQRWLIRRAMSGRLPQEVLWAKQRGAQAADWLHSVYRNRPAARQAFELIRLNELARRALALDRMERLLDAWPEPRPGDFRTQDEYRLLQDGLVAGRFIAWAQGNWA